MLDIYKNIQNALKSLEGALRIAISNADNFNVPGNKYTYTSFATIYANVAFEGSETRNPMQFGSSTTIGSTSTDFTQGNLGFGTNMDAAVSGEGFFVLSASSAGFDDNGDKILTRSGRFQTDFSGQFLVDSFGRKVFGFKTNANGVPISSNAEPITLDGNTDVGFIDGGILVNNYSARNSAIASNSTDPPAHIPLFRLALSSVRNKQGLVLANGTAWRPTTASGQLLPLVMAGQAGLGHIQGAVLESSNVDVAKVALDMNQLNRGIAAVQGIIDDVSKIISGLISKLTV